MLNVFHLADTHCSLLPGLPTFNLELVLLTLLAHVIFSSLSYNSGGWTTLSISRTSENTFIAILVFFYSSRSGRSAETDAESGMWRSWQVMSS